MQIMNWPPKLPKLNTRVAYAILSATIIMGGTLVAIQYAKGNYRFTQDGFVKETGLLSANSFPTGAQVLINDRLVTATDDTLYLDPDTYEVKIIKDGYVPWRKTISIEKELVAQTNARLFPTAPSLTPLTFTGAEDVSLSPDGQKILYYTASASAETKNGLYLLELDNNFLFLQKSARQLAVDVPSWQLNQAQYIWSPDSTQILLITAGHQVLLNLDRQQNLHTLPDVSLRRRQIMSQWEEEIYLRERQYLVKLPPEIIQYATQSARNVYLSPDRKKLLYTAQATYTLPDNILPLVPATNTQPETRNLEPNQVYIYDSEEDKNFQIGQEPAVNPESHAPAFPQKSLLATDMFRSEPLSLDASPSAFTRLQGESLDQAVSHFQAYYTSLYSNSYQWFPDSRHIINAQNNNIKIMSYDGTNDTTIYSGPFAENFTYPWPNGNKLIILAAFNPDSPINLYAVDLE